MLSLFLHDIEDFLENRSLHNQMIYMQGTNIFGVFDYEFYRMASYCIMLILLPQKVDISYI